MASPPSITVPQDDTLSLTCLAGLMMFFAAVALFELAPTDPEDEDDFESIALSLRRTAFSQATYAKAIERYARQQLLELRQIDSPNPAQLLAAMRTIQDGTVRGAFHLRHIFADSLIRSLVISVLRSQDMNRLAVLRRFFVDAGATTLVSLWDTVKERLEAAGGNWYQALGRNIVKQLRTLITNDLPYNLFLSERNGNLQVGTFIDVTEEGIALIGQQRLATLLQTGLDTIIAFGMEATAFSSG